MESFIGGWFVEERKKGVERMLEGVGKAAHPTVGVIFWSLENDKGR